MSAPTIRPYRVPLALWRIQNLVAAYYGLQPDTMLSRNRERPNLLPRHIAIYLCRELTSASYPQIGRVFNLHHTSIISACRKIAALRKLDMDVNDLICEITAKVRDLAPRTCDPVPVLASRS